MFVGNFLRGLLFFVESMTNCSFLRSEVFSGRFLVWLYGFGGHRTPLRVVLILLVGFRR